MRVVAEGGALASSRISRVIPRLLPAGKPQLPWDSLGGKTAWQMDELTTLYRPVGQLEFDLIQQSGRFPPRLPIQPIFYPVLNEDYATQIARDWNTKDAASGYVGYVLRFRVRSDFLAEYPVQTVGAKRHQEVWIPAEQLEEMNNAIVGEIETVSVFCGLPVSDII